MKRIALVACSKTKGKHRAPAAALYTSSLFRKSLLAALTDKFKCHIVSAKHGILDLEDMVDPYNVTLSTMTKAARAEWGAATASQLEKIVRVGDIASLFCGEDYIAPLRTHLARIGCRINLPLTGLSLGQRLQRLRELNDEAALETTFKRFYRIMKRLSEKQEGGRRIADCSGKLVWPSRGVYFITGEEPAPYASMKRVVRIGTHAVSLGSATSLWDRISTHRGTGAGGGSHRSSIFRSHVGRALMNKDPREDWPDTWSKGQTASAIIRKEELDLEQRVSRALGDYRLLWLDVADGAGPASDRAFLERNAIGLLSRVVFLSPGMARAWMGNVSDDWRIAASGLWNLDHLFVRPDPAFLEILEAYVEITIGQRKQPEGSLAPAGWRSQKVPDSDQLNLFAEKSGGHV